MSKYKNGIRFVSSFLLSKIFSVLPKIKQGVIDVRRARHDTTIARIRKIPDLDLINLIVFS